VQKELSPDSRALCAVPAHFDLASTAQQCSTKVSIRFPLPNFPERIFVQVAQNEVSVFIKAARNYFAIQRDHTAVPHLPAMIMKLVFNSIGSIFIFCVTRVAFNGRN